MKWKIILQIVALAGSSAYDWKATSDFQHKFGCCERNSAWVIGKHPNDHKIALFGAAQFGAEAAGIIFAEKHKKLRWPMRVYVSFQVEDHIRLGIRNAKR